jgi:hypothetical protein
MKRVTFAGLVIGGVLALSFTDGAIAQALPGEESQNAATEWQQRVLKKPKQSQWHAVGQTADYEEPVTTTEQPAEQYDRTPAPNRPAYTRQATRRPVQDRYVNNVGVAPKNNGRQHIRLTAGEEVIPAGPVVEPQEQQFEPIATEGEFADNGNSNGCGTCDDGSCGECNACSRRGRPLCNGWEVFDGCCGPWLKGLSVFAGLDGFKGSADYGRNGNFGVNEGLNLAQPLGDPWNVGYQIGANFVQSDFSGAPFAEVDTRDGKYTLNAAYRKQYFVTAALFRRADPCTGGFQGGIAFDYMHDIYYQDSSLKQLRSETSLVLNPEWEIGYYGAYSISNERTWDGKLEATDMFVMFIRKSFENGGDGRLWGGATGNGDGLIGVDLWVPLGRSFALENRANYMIPKQGTNETGQQRESWGLVMQLVWYPGQNAKCQQKNQYRPMFNVADNSLFMIDRSSTAR